MNFLNNKKTFLAKLDKSKKGEIDEKVIPLIKLINSKKDYYTTSSCSGRVYFWRGSGKKNETEWLKISHDFIDASFFDLPDPQGFIWFRLEDFIMHIACKDLQSAAKLLASARKIYKKSSLLSISNKIIVEIRGSEFIEMPFFSESKLLFAGDILFLQKMVNMKLARIGKRIESLQQVLHNFLPERPEVPRAPKEAQEE